MRAGTLRHRVTIRYLQKGRDEWGNPVEEWRDLATVWASVEGLSGRVLFEAQQSVLQSDHRVTMRYRPDVRPGMVVVHDGRQLEIQAVLDEDGRKRVLTLTCREVVPA